MRVINPPSKGWSSPPEQVESEFGGRLRVAPYIPTGFGIMDKYQHEGKPQSRAAKCDWKTKLRISEAERVALTHPSFLFGRNPKVSVKAHREYRRWLKRGPEACMGEVWWGDGKEAEPNTAWPGKADLQPLSFKRPSIPKKISLDKDVLAYVALNVTSITKSIYNKINNFNNYGLMTVT